MNFKVEKKGEQIHFINDNNEVAVLEQGVNSVTLGGEEITMQRLAEELITARKDLEASSQERNSLVERLQQQGANNPQGRNVGEAQNEQNQRGNEQPDSNKRANTTSRGRSTTTETSNNS
jgi:uncharacterized protein YdaU (DUF1376 family)